eukprot:jgi/Psemu1/308577/fgenesh1_kg.422_\
MGDDNPHGAPPPGHLHPAGEFAGPRCLGDGFESFETRRTRQCRGRSRQDAIHLRIRLRARLATRQKTKGWQRRRWQRRR